MVYLYLIVWTQTQPARIKIQDTEIQAKGEGMVVHCSFREEHVASPRVVTRIYHSPTSE